jgi:hypothetical protein
MPSRNRLTQRDRPRSMAERALPPAQLSAGAVCFASARRTGHSGKGCRCRLAADNGRVKMPTSRQARIMVVVVTCAVGATGWLLLGPLGAVIGVAAGALVAFVALGTFIAFAVPSASDHLASHEPYLGWRKAKYDLRSWRSLARWWPGQFLEPVAVTLLVEAEALLALGRRSQALGPAAEAVAIYQDLAARKPRKFDAALAGALDRQAHLLAAAGSPVEAAASAAKAARLYRDLAVPAPGKYLPALAESLTRQATWMSEAGQDRAALEAAAEAAGICQDRLPLDEQPRCAARALLLQGRLLSGQARYQEAASPLARGWQLAASRGLDEDLLASAAQALRAAYRAERAAVRDAWRIAAGSEPPEWLTGPASQSP